MSCSDNNQKDCSNNGRQNKNFKINKYKDRIYHLKDGTVNQNGVEINRIKDKVFLRDKIGGCFVRWGINRYSYSVKPGIYALNSPDENSPVFVSANYKLSFDILRKNLEGIDAWILVLNTKGINVWCAAGKGTFGTRELVQRICKINLKKIVTHRELIVPQLGATGISAHSVKKYSGFSVDYGPVRAKDIKQYLNNGMQAAKAMREIKFKFYDRLILTPIEIIGLFKYYIITLVLFFLIELFSLSNITLLSALNVFVKNFTALGIVYFAGTFLGPVLLPFLLFRSFALKGALLGLCVSLIFIFEIIFNLKVYEKIAFVLLSISSTSFLILLFTGSTTFTSISGVKKEMKIAVPVIIILFISGIITFTLFRYT